MKKMKLATTIMTLVAAFALFASVGFASTTTTINSDGANTGQNAYQIFKSYLGSDPVDGPDSGYITETYASGVGNVFEFYAPADGMYDGSNTDRQRNEIKVYGSSPSNLKATEGSTFTYQWKFKVLSGYATSTASTRSSPSIAARRSS